MATLTERTAVLSRVGLSPLLRQTELEAFYGVSNWTVNQWIQRGCPVERTPSRGRRFDLDAVRAWVADTATSADAA